MHISKKQMDLRLESDKQAKSYFYINSLVSKLIEMSEAYNKKRKFIKKKYKIDIGKLK